MAKAATAPANRARLRWARAHAGLSVDEAARRVNVATARLRSWEEGGADPTINQLRNMARVYRQTVASFLTPGPAPEATPENIVPPDYRGVSTVDETSDPALRREINRAQDRRKALMHLQPQPAGSLPQIAHVAVNPAEAATQFRQKVEIRPAHRFKDAREALAAWIRQAEGMGVLVFQMSRIDPDTCRGISLWHELYPIIILNGGDDAEGRLFTLVHEIAHLLARQSGLCGVLTGPSIEALCNEFAGAVLMPQNEFIAELGEQDPVGSLSRLARTFRVSQSAIAIRLRSLGVLDQFTLNRQLGIAVKLSREKRERQREEARKRKSGPPHHLTQLRNLGSRYVSAVLDALDSDEITTVDAAYFLESKLPTVDRMRSELQRKGGAEPDLYAIGEFVEMDS